jgi:hypothetical protein
MRSRFSTLDDDDDDDYDDKEEYRNLESAYIILHVTVN